MQAVILAAGKSTRAYPLTITKPKPLLKAANKTLLEHNLDGLTSITEEVIIVVGYKKNLIKKYIGSSYKNVKIKYAEQKEQLGTGNALSIAEKHVKNEFICMHGDDIHSEEDFRSVTKAKYSILVKKADNPNQFGVIIEKDDALFDIVEKPRKFISNLVNTGLYKLDKKVFHIIKKLKKSKRNEYELTDAVNLLSKKEKIYCVMAKQWIPIGYPWDLLKADKVLRGRKNVIGSKSKIYGSVENSTIGNRCIIYGKVKNSIIMSNSFVGKNSIVEDSVIGENVNFEGSRTMAKNNSYSIVNGKRVNAGRFGAIIADNVTAKNLVINSGCKIWPNKKIFNRTIKEDVR